MADRILRFSADLESNDGSESRIRRNDFARLLEQHERHVYAYIVSLVPNWTEAEEILQETYIRLFEKVDEWDSRRNFRAWACAIARYQVMTWRKRARRQRMHFGQEFVAAIADFRAAEPDGPDARAGALVDCLEKLDPADRRLVDLVYREGQSIEQAAARVQRSSASAYKALSRIRRGLHECIKRTLRALEHQ